MKPGLPQEGTDIISFQNQSGRNVHLQCKKYLKLTMSELKEAVKEFVEGTLVGNAEVFIIATTAELQHSTDIQQYIEDQKIFFRDQYEIVFDCWDVHRLEDALKTQFRIVQHYFGLAEAKTHCFEPPFKEPVYQAYPNYIERFIKESKENLDEEFPHFTTAPRSTQILSGLISTNYLNRQCICLTGEAYEGKSILLQQTAYELSAPTSSYTALHLILKSNSIQPIEKMLSVHYDTWMEIPAKDLVILIDGLDEVAADKILDVTALVRDFCTEHRSIHVVFSCRKLFSSYYELEKELPDFRFFELQDLSYRQTFSYMDDNLNGRTQEFYSKIQRLDLEHLLAYPFYLVNLVKWFNDPTATLPETKSEIAAMFIAESLQLSSNRKLRAGQQFSRSSVRYQKLLQQLALTLQLLGLNACSDNVIQELFSPEDTELLTHSSILNISKDNWTFNNAFFQEQLAASALLKLNADQVIAFISIGQVVKKISAKWIQTLTTYLSALPEDHTDRQQLIEVIEKDNIELLTYSESSKFQPAFRLEVLKKIIGRSAYHQARLVLVRENNIAEFIGNEDNGVNYLFDTLHSDVPEITKLICARILRHLKLTASQIKKYAQIAEQQLPKVAEPYYGRVLLESLGHYRSSNQLFLKSLITSQPLAGQHEFREGLYRFIDGHGLVNENYLFVLDGLDVLYHYNASISHHGSERRITDLLLKTGDPILIRMLLDKVGSERSQNFFRFNSDRIKEFTEKLADVLIRIYQQSDKTIIFPVIHFISTLRYGDLEKEFNSILRFFEETGTHRLGLQIYLLDKTNHSRTIEYSDYITEGCYDFLLYAYEETLISRQQLDSFVNGLFYKGKRREAERFEKMIHDAFGKPDEKITLRHNLYQQAEINKAKNDEAYIVSTEALKEGIEKIFAVFGKNSLSVKKLYQHNDDDLPLIDVNSDYAFQLLHHYATNKLVRKAKVFKWLNKPANFNLWRIDYLLNSRKFPELVKAELQTYYDQTIGEFSFKDIDGDTQLFFRQKAAQYLRIWKKHQFDTPDDILLSFLRVNIEGLGHLRFAETNKKASITDLMIKHFANNTGPLKQQVLNDLQKGADDYRVIGSLFEISRELKITEAIPYIRDFIYTDAILDGNIYSYVDLFLELKGDPTDLLGLFDKIADPNDYLFIHLVKELRDDFSTVITQKLETSLFNPLTSPERKMESAQQLAYLGNQTGFSYILSFISPTQNAPFHIQSSVKIWTVNTAWALTQIDPLIYMVVDPKFKHFRSFDAPDQFLVELIHGFAQKSEPDLLLVTAFLRNKVQSLAKIYPGTAGNLAWHAEQIAEKFRSTDIKQLSLSQIKTTIQGILN